MPVVYVFISVGLEPGSQVTNVFSHCSFGVQLPKPVGVGTQRLRQA
jgi:hypothetical protein